MDNSSVLLDKSEDISCRLCLLFLFLKNTIHKVKKSKEVFHLLLISNKV